jgi:hypothetical protein
MEVQTMAVQAYPHTRATEFHIEKERRQRVFQFLSVQHSPLSLSEIIEKINDSDDSELKSLDSLELRMLIGFSQDMEISTIKKNGKR